MAEYIEREKLLELYVDGKYDTADYHVPVPVIIQNIKDIPAADVRPVVRCRDCKHYEQLDLFRNSPVWSGMCHYWNCHATREDGFCFKAAKREER